MGSLLSRQPRKFCSSYQSFNRVELWYDEQGILGWHLVNKLPIRSRKGEIIGIMGILQSHSATEEFVQPFLEIAPVIKHIRENFREPIHIQELVELAGVSERHLERKFKDVFGIGPHEFLIKTRVLSACHSLRESSKSLASIAADHGFCDQSSFTHHFKKHIGRTPAQFRRSGTAYFSR